MLSTLQGIDVASLTSAELAATGEKQEAETSAPPVEKQQENKAQQEAKTPATTVDQPQHVLASTEHETRTGEMQEAETSAPPVEKQQENKAQQEAKTLATTVEQPQHVPASTQHETPTGGMQEAETSAPPVEKQQENKAQQEAKTLATTVNQPQHVLASTEHETRTGEMQEAETSAPPVEKQQENKAQQEAKTLATTVEQPQHVPASTQHETPTGGMQEAETSAPPVEKQQENKAQQEAKTSATTVEQPQHVLPSTEHGAVAPTEAEDGQRIAAPPGSRESALERQLAEMQLEVARLRELQAASKAQTAIKAETGSNSDSDLEIVSIIQPKGMKRSVRSMQHLVKSEAVSPTTKRCKQELQESGEGVTMKKESPDKESGTGSNDVNQKERGQRKLADEPFIIKLESPEKEPGTGSNDVNQKERGQRKLANEPFIIKHESPEKEPETSRTEPIQAEGEETSFTDLVACIMLQENSWHRIVSGKEDTLIRSYNLRNLPMELQVLVVKEGNGCVYAGRFTVASTKPVTTVYSIPNPDDRKVWADRINSGKTVTSWAVSEIIEIDNPVKVRFPNGKYKPRHFFCSRDQLGQGFTIDVPGPSLFETPSFFLNLLSPERRHQLEGVARTLHGRTLRVGTACSGTDICVVAIKGLICMMNKVFNAFRQHSAIHTATFFTYIHINDIFAFMYI